MKHSEWIKLSEEERRNAHWAQHPRVRVATIFTILFAIVFGMALLRVFQNKRIHVNRKPNAAEAFATAKIFIKGKFKEQVTFPTTKFDAEIDTAKSNYRISSQVNAQDSTGKFVKTAWHISLLYTGGDWADTKSWRVANIAFEPVSN